MVMLTDPPPENQRQKIREVTMADVEAMKIDWLWLNWIARGHLHLIAGDPDVGKSFLTCELAAIVSSGRSWPDGSPNDLPGDVFMLVGEDDLGHTVRPRLDAHDADVQHVHAFDSREILRPGGLKDFHEAMDRHSNLKLIIVDTLNDFVGIGDGNNNQDAREALGVILNIARERRVAIVLITHTPKRDGRYKRRAIDSVLGARSLSAMPRFVYAVAKSADKPDVRIIAPIKANLVPKKVAKSFQIVDSRLEWTQGCIDMTADDLLNPKRGPAPEKLRECVKWLTATVTNEAWLPSSELDGMAKDLGFSRSTLKRAKGEVEVIPRKFHDKWYCCMKSETEAYPPAPPKPEVPDTPDSVVQDAQPVT